MTFHRGDLLPNKSSKQTGGEKGGEGENILHITEVLTLAEPKVCICAHRSHTGLNFEGYKWPYRSMVSCHSVTRTFFVP
jgi:hypothetical protein